jgi:transposase-like protein
VSSASATRPGVSALIRERLSALYVDQRLSYRAIARELGCSDHAVAAAVGRFGLERGPAPPQPGPDPAIVEQIVGLYRSGLDLRQVAARTGIARDRIAPQLRKAGVRLRKRGARPHEHLDPQKLRAAYEAGASLRALATQEGTAEAAVREALLRAVAVLRRPGGFHKWASVLTKDFLTEQYIE